MPASQLQHSFAPIDAINFEQRLAPQERGEKSSIPLAHDQRATRRTDVIETGHARPLQRVSESDHLQRPIPRRDRIEAHKAITINAAIGVSRTKSASAVRWSTPKER